MSARPLKIETIPDIPEDFEEPLKSILKAIKGGMDVREGRIGPVEPFKVRANRFVTILDLLNAGISIVNNGISFNAPRFSDNETPEGTIDGSNADFTLAHVPNPPESLMWFKNGQRMDVGEGNPITLDDETYTYAAGYVPIAGANPDTHYVWYRY